MCLFRSCADCLSQNTAKSAFVIKPQLCSRIDKLNSKSSTSKSTQSAGLAEPAKQTKEVPPKLIPTNKQELFSQRLQNMQVQKLALLTGLIGVANSSMQRLKQLQAVLMGLVAAKRVGKPTTQIIEANDQTKILSKYFKNQQFKYELALAQPLTSPIIKQRNFNINLVLRDKQGKSFSNIFSFYLVTRIPNPFNSTLTVQCLPDQPILRIGQEPCLHLGQCEIKKLQVREVSSHYTKGVVTLIIHAKQGLSVKGGVNSADIKPLILQSLIIKAKKQR